jgi:hypothetical protein
MSTNGTTVADEAKPEELNAGANGTAREKVRPPLLPKYHPAN